MRKMYYFCKKYADLKSLYAVKTLYCIATFNK